MEFITIDTTSENVVVKNSDSQNNVRRTCPD